MDDMREEDLQHVYHIGEEYKDSRNPEIDEFQKWINGPINSGIRNSGGIRTIEAESGSMEGQIAGIVLMSSELENANNENRWEDEFHLEHGKIEFWGDAKRRSPGESVDRDDFRGNTNMRRVQQYTKNRTQYPPILAFRKLKSGTVEFAGLCVIDQVIPTEFDDSGGATPNYLFYLDVLDTEWVPVRWLHDRALSDESDLTPEVWKQWIRIGEVTPAIRYGVSENSLPKYSEETSGTTTTSERTRVRVSPSFKEQVRSNFNHRCAVTKIQHPKLLTVSHILSRAYYPMFAEHEGNVLLLNRTHHFAFDAGLWTFDTDRRLWVNRDYDPQEEWMHETLHERQGMRIPALANTPVSDAFVQKRNESLDWWPPEDR
jgi:hypothetical protein